MSLSMDSLTEPTECQGQRDNYVTGRFWWLWSLTGEPVDGFTVSITQSLFKGTLKKAQALVASCFVTGQCWCGLKLEGFTYSIINIHYPFLSCVSLSGLRWQAKEPTEQLFRTPRSLNLSKPCGRFAESNFFQKTRPVRHILYPCYRIGSESQ